MGISNLFNSFMGGLVTFFATAVIIFLVALIIYISIKRMRGAN